MTAKERGGRAGKSWSTRSTRPNAKPRGKAPDYLKRIEQIRAAIARYGVAPERRESVRQALEKTIAELDKPIII